MPASRPPDRQHRRWWLVLLRVPLMVLVALGVGWILRATGQLASSTVTGSGPPSSLGLGPSAAKHITGIVHTALVRLPQLPVLLGGIGLAALVLPRIDGRRWWLAAGVFSVAIPVLLSRIPTGPWPLLAALLLLLLANLRPAPKASPHLTHGAGLLHRLAALPGIELLLPVPVLRRAGAGSGVLRAAALLASLGLGMVWFLADSGSTAWVYARAVTAWDPARSLPWAQRMAAAPDGVHCEFHDVDIVGKNALVVAESSHSLTAWPLDGGQPQVWKLPQPWQPYGGLTLDSETDPKTGTTWFVDGPNVVGRARLDAHTGWQDLGHTTPVSPPFHHSYLFSVPQRDALVLLTVNAATGPPDPSIGVIDLHTPNTVQRRPLHSQSTPFLPNFRSAVWVPPLQRLVAAPAQGEQLWLIDPWSGQAEPWVQAPAHNGQLVWAQAQQLLYLSVPDRLHVLVIDPSSARIERTILTQPGARALAVDETRGLLLTGSVLTGVVLVQRLDTGLPVRAIGTVMPMMREIALIPGRPQAVLTTWGSLYRLTYADN